ncbi:DUF1501 domain-containing protein [Aureliella helgolandensis]|uniref:Sulfatase n=1 Tax=Aureliella helgolandensis TaxID=2527968 RepID=A0A518G5T7_9BACT|nr:DUF1501 domain-containing protein [Aureliella helgolandensis]QDV23953.1 hypothetical protein Q31a_22660 [Aureliella helgolandensis]
MKRSRACANNNDADMSRRRFLATTQGLLGVTCAGGLGLGGFARSAASETGGQTSGAAKHVIYLYMNGAMSHLDTFDPKVGTDAQGETTTTKTRLAGVEFSDKLPKLAYLMNGMALIRSMTTETGAHEQGCYQMRTSYKPLNSIRHPGMGAWANHVHGKLGTSLPGNVLIGAAAEHPRAGFLPASLAPVPVNNPKTGLQNTASPDYLADDQFRRRMSLANQFDLKFRTQYKSHLIEAYDQTYREAVRLMGSSELKAFDIKEEKEEVREFYGNNSLGQGCLLARRLVERGVRFVEVQYGGWDHHNDIYDALPAMVTNLDNALGALLRDLANRGMLGEVLVVLATEFGRSPTINENAGRDHHPGAFSALLCGAGIRGGTVYGKSDERGHSVEEDAVYPEDLNATIAATMGLPLDEEFIAPNGRPFKICNNGTPIAQILR